MSTDVISVEELSNDYYDIASEWLNNPDINKWLYAEWRNRKVDSRLVAMVSANLRNRLMLVTYENSPVGLVGLGEINSTDQSASIWYLLGQSGNGSRGWISNAVELTVDYAFNSLKLHTIYASIVEGNKGSRRVLEKNQFVEVGRFREGFRCGDQFMDRIVFDRVATQ